MAKTLEQAETVLRIALEELAGAENVAYPGLPWSAIYKALKELGMEAEPAVMEPYAKMVMAEGKRWQKAALQKLWGLLGLSMPPWAYERLESENWEVVWTAYFEKKAPQVRVGFPFKDPLVFPLSQPHPSGFAIGTWPGGMEVNIKGLYARKGQACLMADPVTDTGAILAGVRSLAPLFTFLDLADLEDALLALRGLEEGEHQRKGAYFLAREGGTRVLFRGSLTGDPDLDGALLLGREVVLGTGEIALRLRTRVEVEMGGLRMRIEEGSLAWGEEAVPLPSPSGTKFVLQKKNALIHLLRESLRSASRLMPPPSPRMRGLIEELVETDPIEALKAEDLPSRAYMRLLSYY
jgi:hypothetical protein